jgi:hypothetical protein
VFPENRDTLPAEHILRYSVTRLFPQVTANVHPETRYFVLIRGALTNVTAGIHIIFRVLHLTAQQRVRRKEAFLDGHVQDSFNGQNSCTENAGRGAALLYKCPPKKNPESLSFPGCIPFSPINRQAAYLLRSAGGLAMMRRTSEMAITMEAQTKGIM